MKKNILWMVLAAWIGGGCSNNESYSEYERTEASFLAALKGEVSPIQWWKTTVALKVNVATGAPVKLWLMSAEANGTLYDYKEAERDGTVYLTAPQGLGSTVYLACECKRELSITPILLSGKSEETVTLNGAAAPLSLRTAAAGSPEQASENSPLQGASAQGNGTYYQFSDTQLSEYLDMMDRMSMEGVNAKTGMELNCDYELKSNGPFSITWVAGNSLSSSPHVLGYYYHSPGTYSDIRYVDLSETEIYDYIDGIAKVQYQVNATAAAAFGLEEHRWYDANFDMYDRWDATSSVTARRNDDAYNIMAAFKRYGRNLSGLRGISFVVDVPPGMHIGFYDRWETQSAPEQYDRLVRQGVKPYTSREAFKGTSYSAEGMNSYNSTGNFRSFIDPHTEIMWMGMENDCRGGDLDCNDVIFGVTEALEIYRPSIIEPDLAPKGEYGDLLPWTLAYEDVSREADFDFNDAVIRVVPDYNREVCCITLMAVGSASRMYLHYDGPDGDQNLGELHALMGRRTETKINTSGTWVSTPFVEIDCVKWPRTYRMDTDARRFYIEIQRGTCSDCTDVITLAEEPGRIPEALLVAGEWKWPKEGVHIISAYNIFPLWAKDATKLSYWSWHESPKSGYCLSY